MATPELVSRPVNKWPSNTSSDPALPETHSSGPGSTAVHKVVMKMLKEGGSGKKLSLWISTKPSPSRPIFGVCYCFLKLDVFEEESLVML